MKAKINGYEIECSISEFRELLRNNDNKEQRKQTITFNQVKQFQRPTTSRKRQRWSKIEDQELLNTYANNKNHAKHKLRKGIINKLARKLNRPRGGVTWRAHILGFSKTKTGEA